MLTNRYRVRNAGQSITLPDIGGVHCIAGCVTVSDQNDTYVVREGEITETHDKGDVSIYFNASSRVQLFEVGEVPTPGESTYDELYEQAQAQDVKGRSTMTKDELKEAVK